MQRFVCMRGKPTRIQFDRGDQLVAASKQMKESNFSGVQEWAGKNGIEWHLVPTGGQLYNEQAERMIGILEKQVYQSFKGIKYTHEETCTILKEADHIVNSHPLTVSPSAQKILCWGGSELAVGIYMCSHALGMCYPYM